VKKLTCDFVTLLTSLAKRMINLTCDREVSRSGPL
jgi:hypothetical protein